VTGRRALAFLLLLALLAPIGALAAAGGCEDECSPGCGDCGLCLGVAVTPAASPGLAAGPVATVFAPHSNRPRGAPLGVPEPVPLPRA
jgi:hypothetical protein